MTRKPVWVSTVQKIIRTLRAEGSLRSEELRKRVSMPRRTFYRALSALSDAGVVSKDGERYYWYESLDTRTYRNKFEADLALKHSIKIASGLKHKIEGYRSYFVEGELPPKSEYVEPALMHLRTGYSGIYKVFEKAEEANRLANEKEAKFKEGIKAKLLATSPQMPYPVNVVDIILDIILTDIKEVLRGRRPRFLNDLSIKDGNVTSLGYTLSVEIDMLEPLKNFIMKEEASKENRESFVRIVKLENKRYTLNQKFEREIRKLIMQVENGTTLKGSCEFCPKVKIMRSTGD